MKHSVLTKTMMLMFLLLWCRSVLAAGDNTLLWQIGKVDNNTAEFALGPDRSNQYSTSFPNDALFVAGQSDPKKDWPYIQPGPADVWAGGKSHTFTILFGLKMTSTEGKGQIVLDFVDTHSAVPPKMEVKINDISFIRELPRGAGDDSAHGQPDKGSECRLVIDFPAGALKGGSNHIAITTLEGSWVLYDQVALTVPSGFEAGPVDPVTEFLNVQSQPYLLRHDDGKMYQPVLVSVLHIGQPAEAVVEVNGVAVSYTHLTLPTILLV